jgi:hypothetical protein
MWAHRLDHITRRFPHMSYLYHHSKERRGRRVARRKDGPSSVHKGELNASLGRGQKKSCLRTTLVGSCRQGWDVVLRQLGDIYTCLLLASIWSSIPSQKFSCLDGATLLGLGELLSSRPAGTGSLLGFFGFFGCIGVTSHPTHVALIWLGPWRLSVAIRRSCALASGGTS